MGRLPSVRRDVTVIKLISSVEAWISPPQDTGYSLNNLYLAETSISTASSTNRPMLPARKA